MIPAPPPSDRKIAERIVTAFSWRGVALMGVAQNLSDEIERALSAKGREARAAAIEEYAAFADGKASHYTEYAERYHDSDGDHAAEQVAIWRKCAASLRALLAAPEPTQEPGDER